MSIFTIYKNKEDQITSTLMSILKNTQKEILDKFLEELDVIQQFPTIQIINQSGKSVGRPDGEIISNFQILIESKVSSDYNQAQSLNHLKSFDEMAQRMIYLLITKESLANTKIDFLKQVNPKINIKNILWSEIYQFFANVAIDVINFNEKTRFLAQQLTEYFEEVELDKSWKERCVIVPGNIALEESNNFGLCLWSPDKIKKKCGYIAFYDDKKIQSLFQIKSSLIIEFEGLIPSINDFKNNVEIIFGEEFLSDAYESLKILEASKMHKWGFHDQVIIYYFDKMDNLIKYPILHNDKGAYIQRPVYKWYDKLIKAKNTTEIA